ncbi:MAG: 30S ribosomal protein S18 [Candidatus Schekmanbacteria bacterium]|nr:30S ribosomal protein S18 [Candidatus Schekmanbacteria bacterium]
MNTRPKRAKGLGRKRRKFCRFCADASEEVVYTEVRVLRNFLTERGKIIARRISGNCAKHQRQLTRAIKRSRCIAILPFVAE